MPVSLTIDGRSALVPEGTNLIEAAATVGITIPHFCYHPHLKVAGNCRMCLVRIEGMRNLEIACNTAVREGMVVRTDAPDVLHARRAVMEFLLLNHPLDCPICDQAGECFLQDHWNDHARHASRRHEPRITRQKRRSIGTRLVLDQERCIACARCVRFCDDVTGTSDLALLQRGDHVTIDTAPGHHITHPYQVCLAEICPVGALTAKDFRFRKRVWMLHRRPTVCNGCATGCNLWAWEEEGRVHRLTPRRNDAVNKSWMCDFGRYTLRSLDREDRPLLGRIQGRPVPVAQALDAAARVLSGARVGLVLGCQATCEANQALLALRRALPSARVFWCPGRDPDRETCSDSILIHGDKNPNRAAVAAMEGVEDKASLEIALRMGELDGVLALADDIPGRLDLPMPPGLVHLTWRASAAPIVIPIAASYEEDGTFVNFKGLAQRFQAVVPPPGEARPAVQVLQALGALLEARP